MPRLDFIKSHNDEIKATYSLLSSLRVSEANEAIHKDSKVQNNSSIFIESTKNNANIFAESHKDSSDFVESTKKFNNMDCHSPKGLRNDGFHYFWIATP